LGTETNLGFALGNLNMQFWYFSRGKKIDANN